MLKKIKYFFEDYRFIFIIVLIGIGVIAALVFALSAWEHNADDNNRSDLIQHQETCEGTPELKASYASYGKSPTYVYECPNCHEIFEFHNVDTFREVVN